MSKTQYTHPFLVKAELPAGHPFGRKKRTFIRNSRHKTFKEAMSEQQSLKATGSTLQLVYEGKLCIFNSTNTPVIPEAMLHDFGARGLEEGLVMKPEGFMGTRTIIKLKK